MGHDGRDDSNYATICMDLRHGEPAQMALFILTAAAVLDGAIFGDHCAHFGHHSLSSVVLVATTCTMLHSNSLCIGDDDVASVTGYVTSSIFGVSAWVFFVTFHWHCYYFYNWPSSRLLTDLAHGLSTSLMSDQEWEQYLVVQSQHRRVLYRTDVFKG